MGAGVLDPPGRAVCRKTWGREDRDALQLSLCAALKSTAAALRFASSALQLPMVLTVKHSVYQTAATGLRIPLCTGCAPVKASTLITAGGSERA